MARKVQNITNSASYYDIISQTPGNYTKDNYFLKELQEKIDAEWCYRPNRVTIEFESERATMDKAPYLSEWSPIEVVEQTVKNDKGQAVSQDYLKFVFRDISESRFTIGSKFRMGKSHDITTPDDKKTVWLVVNTSRTGMTKSVVTRRCNGVLGSTFIDHQGITHYHYEPVVQSGDLTGTGLFYNQVANVPRAQLVITAQANEFTAQYKINQRFIIGARYYSESGGTWQGQVYRVNAINRAYSNSTYDPENLGTIELYLEITESSPYDNFEQRIAYQENSTTVITDGTHEYDPVNTHESYHMGFTQPTEFPEALFSEIITFVPVIQDASNNVMTEAGKYIQTTYELQNCPEGKEDRYIDFIEYAASGDDPYKFTLQRKKIYLNGSLIVTCRLPAEHSPSGEEIIGSFSLVVREQEA